MFRGLFVINRIVKAVFLFSISITIDWFYKDFLDDAPIS